MIDMKKLMKMSEGELADLIDEVMTGLLKDVKGTSQEKNIKTIRACFRILQLQLNHIKARADLGKYHFISHMKTLDPEIKDFILKDVTEQKEKDNIKTLEEIKEGKK